MSSAECRRNVWWVAIAGGVLMALMLIVVAKYAVLSAFLIGAIFAAALGLFLGWAFCTKVEEALGGDAPAQITPKPEPVPAPDAAAAKEPVVPPAPLVSAADAVTVSKDAKPEAPAKLKKPAVAKKPKAAKPAAKKTVKDKPAPKKAALCWA